MNGMKAIREIEGFGPLDKNLVDSPLDPIGHAFVDSHPFAKCAKGWGTRLWTYFRHS